jgi:hypothetical protein
MNWNYAVVGIIVIVIIALILIMTKNENYQEVIECRVSPWSQWQLVGEKDGKKIQQRTRMTLLPPPSSSTCPPLVQERTI